MLSKTHEIEKQLDTLIRDTKATESSLHSVFNDFLMLSNTQFIENVMYIIETFLFYFRFACYTLTLTSHCTCVLLQPKLLQRILWWTLLDVIYLVTKSVLLQRVYDEEVEETIPKADGLEKQPEQV